MAISPSGGRNRRKENDMEGHADKKRTFDDLMNEASREDLKATIYKLMRAVDALSEVNRQIIAMVDKEGLDKQK